LFLNIDSNNDEIKIALNIEILKYYGFDWLIDFDNEYEKLNY
jgi:hypothetical protein